MKKYKARGQVFMRKESEERLYSIDCLVYGSSPIEACENLVNGRRADGVDGVVMFVAVETETPGHLLCPLTGGHLSFIEEPS